MTACKYAGRGEPRILPGRHGAECPENDPNFAAEGCAGCLPCPERHCPVCSRVHADGACPECLAATRDDLAAIRLMCGALPAEVAHRGVNGEAMMLLGPSADPEAWRNRAMSAMRGRLDDAYLADCRDEQHPLWVLGTWEQLYRDELDHPSDLRQTIERAGDYLDRHLHRLAEHEDVPFEDFARDVRGCRGHLEDVLSDRNQGDRANVGCFDCGGALERRLTDAGFEDHWTCRRCRRRYTYAEYNFALRAALEERTSA